MEKNMENNFTQLEERIYDALNNTNLEHIRNELANIHEPTIVTGVGGSSVVAEFVAKVLVSRNKVISVNHEPKTFVHNNLYGYKNVISCSYSGNNYGVDLSLKNNLKKYLLSNNMSERNGTINLTYNTSIEKEKSFISLGATLIPISIILDYYCSSYEYNFFLDDIEERVFDFEITSDTYEIFTGYDTSGSAKYLESTLVEAGIGIPILHDKYSYCHGRSTFTQNFETNIIYFYRNNELDDLEIEQLIKTKKNIIILESGYYGESVLCDYELLIKCMYLTKYIASKKNMDLSKVNYHPMTKKLYPFKGKIN